MIPASFSLKFFVGGYFGTNQTINIVNGKIHCVHSDYPFPQNKLIPVECGEFSESMYNNLIQTLEKIDFKNWKDQDNPNLLEGTQWKIEYSSPELTKSVYGSNAYPGSKGMKYSKKFKMLLRNSVLICVW